MRNGCIYKWMHHAAVLCYGAQPSCFMAGLKVCVTAQDVKLDALGAEFLAQQKLLRFRCAIEQDLVFGGFAQALYYVRADTLPPLF